MSWIARLVEKKIVIYTRVTRKDLVPQSWILLNQKSLELGKEYNDSQLEMFFFNKEKGIYLYLFRKK